LLSHALKKGASFIIAVSLSLSLHLLIKNWFDPQNNFYTLGILAVTTYSYWIIHQIFYSSFFYKTFGYTNTEFFKYQVNKFKKNVVYTTYKDLNTAIKHIFSKLLNIKGVKLIIVNDSQQKKLPNLVKFFEKNHDIQITNELMLKEEIRNEKIKHSEELMSLGNVCLPLYQSSKSLIGMLVLGNKPFNDPYTEEEIKALEDIKLYLSLELTGILFNSELQKEVDQKTQELQIKNEALHESYKQLIELDHHKDHFLSIASHELRTPMTVMKGYADFLLTEKFGKLNEKQKKYLDKIYDNTSDLIELVNKMLNISRLESGRIEFKAENLNLAALIKDITNEFRLVCKEKKLKLTFRNPEKLKPIICSDEEKLKIIITNLLGNAYKFTPEGGSISVSLKNHEKKKGFYQISVKDTGIGIPKEKQYLLFQKFQQLENVMQKQYTGSGLGLSIVKGYIEKFGGKIWIESKAGKGTEFIFIIPPTCPPQKKSSSSKTTKI